MHTFYKLVKHDFIRELPPYKYEKDRVCTASLRGRQLCTSFKYLKNMSTLCLVLLQMDLCGPIRVKSFGGSSYIFVIVDD